MSWRIHPHFLQRTSQITSKYKKTNRGEEVVFEKTITEDPFQRGKTKKLVGYQEYYRIRFGSYRVGLRIDSENNMVEFRRVLHRKEIYRKFP
ncbi:type II toxin-antitoxin system RelE/ParE family toxin [Anaerolineales bacterium HSG6]|nr:type II toxin-antitoxin system RelE/ParE family toxin [Anaerolineales bacterium HSG6]